MRHDGIYTDQHLIFPNSEGHIRFHVLDHAIDGLQGSLRIRFVQHSRQEVLHAILEVKHAVL